VVEKVAAVLLSEEAERRGLLSDGQFGSKKGLSAIDAVASMVDRAQAAWKTATLQACSIWILGSVPERGKRKTSQLNEGQGNGWRS